MRKVLLVLLFCGALSQPAFAAQVSVEICASASVQFLSTHTGTFSGFEEQCIDLELNTSLNGDETWQSAADAKTLSFPVGGCIGDNEVKQRVTYNWRYDISKTAEEGEEVTAVASISLKEESFKDGSASDSLVFEETLPANLCTDGFVEISARASASTKSEAHLGFTFSNPFGVNGLFVDGSKPNSGFDFNVHDFGMTVFYYGTDDQGQPMWFISEPFAQSVQPFGFYTLDMYEVVDGTSQLAGTLNLEVYDCESGFASLNIDRLGSSIHSSFDRLAGYHGVSCQ